MSYGQFQVKGPGTSYIYTLQVSDQQHTGYDFLGYYHTGKKFVTKDRTSGNTCMHVLQKQREAGGSVPVQRSTGTYMPFDYAE